MGNGLCVETRYLDGESGSFTVLDSIFRHVGSATPPRISPTPPSSSATIIIRMCLTP